MKLSERILKVAKHRGAPSSLDLIAVKDYPKFLSDIAYENTGTKFAVSVKQQIDMITESIDNPNRGNPVFVISSALSPMKAQQLALALFYNAIDEYNHKEAQQRDHPLWHTVYGGYSDKLRDAPVSKNPSMIVIDGLVVNATDVKIEKARDLLMKFSDIPRVVITCGVCPMQFAYERLYHAVNRVAYFGGAKHTSI